MTDKKRVIGSGGGGKGRSRRPRTPREAPDSLRSIQHAEIIDLIGEGEIEGLVNGEASIFLDDTPVRNANGTYNFDGFDYSFVPGTQEQPALPGFRNVGNEVNVGVEVTVQGGPVVRQVTNSEVDAVRVTIQVPALSHTNISNGDTNGTTVQIAIDVQVGSGGWVQQVHNKITGKTGSPYQRSYYIRLPEGDNRAVRVRRITGDSTTQYLVNQTYWASYTEVVESIFNYPNSALIGFRIDAEQFGRIPNRGYDMRLLRVRVPTNYDPINKTYSGLWDGSFKIAWTDNPAWCWYDMVTSERYGLGKYVNAALVDRWALYQIGQYCDELVDDGRGGKEPRFTLNIYLQTREEAVKVVRELAGVFNGIVFASSAGISVAQDRPSPTVKQFTAANVIDGEFNYSGTARNARHTVALVTWNDPNDMYRQKVEYVADEDAIRRFGVREKEVTAIGCTSQGMANRVGRHIIYSETIETEVVTFRTGLEGANIVPGDVIQTADPYRSGERMGGRIVDATESVITLDQPVELREGRTYTLSVIMPDGTLEERGVMFDGEAREETELILASPLPSSPQIHSVWVLSASDLTSELWRVMSLIETEPHIVEITALTYHPDKHLAIEQGIKLDERPTSTIRWTQSPVTGLISQTQTYQVNPTTFSTRIAVSWEEPTEGAAHYIIQWRVREGNWSVTETHSTSYDINDVLDGEYEISIIAVNAIGRQSVPSLIVHGVETDTAHVPPITGLQLEIPFVGDDVSFMWDEFPGAQHYQIQIWAGGALRHSTTTLTPYYTYYFLQNSANGGPFRTVEIRVRARTLLGYSDEWTHLDATNPQIGAPTVHLLDTANGIQVTLNVPTEPDWMGSRIWVSQDPSFDPLNTTPRYDGTDASFQIEGLEEGVWYVRAAHYDHFGPDNLNISTAQTIHVSKMSSGVSRVLNAEDITTNPHEDPPGGEDYWAVYSLHDQKMWRWNREEGRYTSSVDGEDILANSIAANQLNISELSAISSNLGNATAGTFTLDAQGFIRGGAESWTTGKGTWQGYDLGDYKWRVGTPGGSGASWDGTNFTIYDSNGDITIQSGSSIGYDSWSELVGSVGQLGSENISTVIADAAIGSAQIGSVSLVGTNNFRVRSATAGARMDMDSRAIKVFDESGTLRVQLGNLNV